MKLVYPEFHISSAELDHGLCGARRKLFCIRVRKVGFRNGPETKEAASRVFRAHVDDLLRLVPLLTRFWAIGELWSVVRSVVDFFEVHHDAGSVGCLEIAVDCLKSFHNGVRVAD